MGDRGWMESLQEVAGTTHELGRDAGVLEALDELPSLDPFLLREHMKRRCFDVAETHFEISSGDLEMMQQFVGAEIGKLIDLAYRGRAGNEANTARLVQALLSSRNDERLLSQLRLTLRLEGDSYREGIFSWKGLPAIASKGPEQPATGRSCARCWWNWARSRPSVRATSSTRP